EGERHADTPESEARGVAEELRVCGCRERGVQPGCVRDVADARAQPPPLPERIEPEYREAARCRARGGGDDAKQCRLARAVLTQHGQVLARVNGKVDHVKRDL